MNDRPNDSNTTPAHPLVIDRHTKVARLATQDDIHRMEIICSAYDAIMRAHPLVIDRHTKVARLATQDDIHRMEIICSAYDAIMREFAERVRMHDRLAQRVERLEKNL